MAGSGVKSTMSIETEPNILISPGILDQLHENVDSPWIVILYNDDWHPYDQVVFQVQKATGCTLEYAIWITQEAHSTGRAVAFSGSLDECERVCAVLREIRLQVEVDKG